MFNLLSCKNVCVVLSLYIFLLFTNIFYLDLQKIAKKKIRCECNLCHFVFWYECSDIFIYIYACFKFYDLDMCIMF